MKKKPTELAGRKGITTSHPTLKMRWLEREFGGWDDALFGRRWLGRQRLVSSCHQRSGGHEYIQRRVRSIQVKYSRIFKNIQEYSKNGSFKSKCMQHLLYQLKSGYWRTKTTNAMIQATKDLPSRNIAETPKQHSKH